MKINDYQNLGIIFGLLIGFIGGFFFQRRIFQASAIGAVVGLIIGILINKYIENRDYQKRHEEGFEED